MNTEPDPQTLHVQQLYVRHQQSLLAYVMSMEPNYADAQDIVQEVFLTITKKAKTWTPETDFLAWVCTVARYEVLQFQRTRSRRAARLDEDVIELLHVADMPDETEFRQRLVWLQCCLGKLAPRARELIVRRYHNAQMPEQIAPAIGWSVGAVRVALTRARQFLRTCFERQAAMSEAP